MKKNIINTRQIILATLLVSSFQMTLIQAMNPVEIGGKTFSPSEYLGTLLNATYQQQIQALLQDANTPLQQKITQLQTIATNITNDAQRNSITAMPEQLQDTYAQALVNLFEQSTSPDAPQNVLNAMNDLLNYAQNSPLLRSEQQTYVRNEMLTKLKPSAPVITVTIDDINAALQADSYLTKMNALLVLIEKGKGLAFDPTIQDAFGSALVSIFNERGQQEPTSLKKLGQLLNAAKTASLLAPAQQVYVAEQMIPQLSPIPQRTPPTKKLKQSKRKTGKRKAGARARKGARSGGMPVKG